MEAKKCRLVLNICGKIVKGFKQKHEDISATECGNDSISEDDQEKVYNIVR